MTPTPSLLATLDSLNREVNDLDIAYERGGMKDGSAWQSKRTELVTRRDRLAKRLEARGAILHGGGRRFEDTDRAIAKLPVAERAETQKLFDSGVKAEMSGERVKALRIFGEVHLKLHPEPHEVDETIALPAAAPAPQRKPEARKPYVMPPDKAARLAKINDALDRARDAGDQEAFRAAYSDDEYGELVVYHELAEIDQVPGGADNAARLKTYAAVLGLRVSALRRHIELGGILRGALRKRVDDLESRLASVDEQVERAMAPLLKRITELESRVEKTVSAEGLDTRLAAFEEERADARKTIDSLSEQVAALKEKTVTADEARGMLETETARFELDLERRMGDIAQRLVDQIPRPQDGKDGFTVDDFSLALEGRTFTAAMRCGDRIVEKHVRVPFPIYRGIYRHKVPYEAGDMVTFGGSVWLSKKDKPTTRPPSDDWQLVVQKREGRKAMNANLMPAAFDSAGHVDGMIVVTSARMEELVGHPLRSKLAAFIICGGKGVKGLEINTGDELSSAIKTYAPATVSVAGAPEEHDAIEALERAIAMLLSLPPGEMA